MPIYTVPARSPSEAQCTTTLQKSSSENTFTSSKASGQQLKSQVSGEGENSLLSCSQNRTEEVNRTYVISACKKVGDTSTTFKPEGRLTLQRRAGASKKSASSSAKLHVNAMQGMENTQTEKRLTLQRRVRTGSIEKSKINQNTVPGIENNDSAAQGNYKIAFPPNINNNDTHAVKPSLKLAEGQSSSKLQCNLNSKDSFGFVDGLCENDRCVHLKYRTGAADTKFQNQVPKSQQLVTSKYINRMSGEQLSEKGNMNKLAGKQRLQHFIIKQNSLERPRTPTKGSTEGLKLTPKNSTSQDQPSLPSSNKRTPHLQILAKKTPSVFSSPAVVRSSKTKETTETLAESNSAESNSTEKDVFKVENSKVVVAVRVRPFSNRFVSWTYF